jgi:Glycosyl hydrolase family 79 C-terminal beta domain
VSTALPHTVPLAGPASGASAWLTGLGRYLRADPRVGLVTFHRYPLHRCFTPRSSPDFPTIGNLLSPAASTGLADSLEQAVQAAHARGIPFRADELNSVSCGGARRVSDTFASALWVLDTLFGMARVGVDGVNIHTFRNAIYEPFAFGQAGGRWTARVRPMYYGMLLFARAAPPGAQLLATTMAQPSTRHPRPAAAAPAGLRVWATRAPDGRVRVVLINDSPHSVVTTAVRPPRAAATATAERLRAPRIGARGGITIAGQSFGSRSTTAVLAGPLRQQTLTAVQGRFVVRLPAASATLLTVGT